MIRRITACVLIINSARDIHWVRKRAKKERKKWLGEKRLQQVKNKKDGDKSYT